MRGCRSLYIRRLSFVKYELSAQEVCALPVKAFSRIIQIHYLHLATYIFQIYFIASLSVTPDILCRYCSTK